MDITFQPTPFGTVRVDLVVPVADVGKVKRSVSSQAGKRHLGKRLSVREHRFGSLVRVGIIYRKTAA